MAKPKLKQPQTGPEMEECIKDGWVVVKKQKVNILIPSLPITEPSPMPSMGLNTPRLIATKPVDHITPPQPESPLEKTNPLTTPVDLTARPRNPNKEQPICRKRIAICNASKARKYCGILNSKMRALNLERKLDRAGGLNRWLVSLGLSQFVHIFRCKRIGKVQLVNLTMKNLKEMGAHAVGPRRKLMHAMDCLW